MAQKNNKTKKLSTVKNQAGLFELVEKERDHIFNIASDFILVADIKTGMIVDANLTAQRILGKNLNQIRKMHQSQLHHKSEEAKYRQLFKKHIAMGKGILRDIYVIGKNKKLVPFDVNIKLIKINKRNYAIGIFRDVSDRKKTEDELYNSLDKYKILSDNNPNFIFVIDKKHKILNLNKSSANLLHQKAELLIGQSIKDVFPKEVSSRYIISLNKVFKTKKSLTLESTMPVGGRIFYISTNLTPLKDNNGSVYAVLGDVRDLTNKKKIEEKIEESEAKYHGIFESAMDGLFLMDGQLFIDCNNTTIKMFGCHKKSDVINHTPFDFSPLKQPDGQSSIKKGGNFIKKALLGKPQKFYWQHLTKSGKPFDAEVSLNVVTLNDKKFIQAIVRDITDRRKIEEELIRQKHKFETIFDLLPNFVIYKSNNDKFLEVNKVFVDWIGLPKEKIIGKTTYDLILDKKIAQATREDDLEILRTGKSKLNIIRNFVSPFNQNSMWGIYSKMPFFDLNGKIIGTLTVTSDITKIIKSEKEVERQKAALINVLDDVKKEKDRSNVIANDLKKFELAVDNASDQIVITDKNGIILYANNSTENITGFKVKDILGKKIGSKDLWGNKINEEFYQKMWKKIKVDKKLFTSELTNHHKDGSNYNVLINIAPVLDSKGEIIYFVLIERDITKEKEIDKMKTEFVSIASHQLRTPLTGIKWFLELLLNQKVGDLNKKQIEFLNQVTQSNERMISLVGDLLSVSRIEMGGQKFKINKKNIDIVPVIDSVLSDNVALIEERKIKVISCTSKHNKIMILVDSEYIRQVFYNLISNAIKYSNISGKVEIGCKLKDEDKIFFIKDNGVGIPVNQQKRIFEKFFRADNIVTKETSGTGLGLYIAKAIVEGHGGKIWFESEAGNGTTFYFSIPNK